ncbi:MAG: cob(I)yrinic acid a,c-diamide adenosyltransferase [Ignavibacteriaceae bacterium]|nr:cob(I)yrinic acid a,c-diamide adenosyltransferase [Ignavibacteriaceae bacterium]
MKTGYIHVYTGNGKGKTTAAIGQVVRAAGSGLKSYFLMLMKDYPYSEVVALKNLSGFITVVQAGGDDFVYNRVSPSQIEINKIKDALLLAKNAMISGDFDIVVIDEAFVSIYFNLITEADLLDFIAFKPAEVELILTGRYATESILEKADLVTEMKEIKHYYERGVKARKGIES